MNKEGNCNYLCVDYKVSRPKLNRRQSSTVTYRQFSFLEVYSDGAGLSVDLGGKWIVVLELVNESERCGIEKDILPYCDGWRLVLARVIYSNRHISWTLLRARPDQSRRKFLDCILWVRYSRTILAGKKSGNSGKTWNSDRSQKYQR